MIRSPLIAAALLPAMSGAALAETDGWRSSYVVERTTDTRPDAVVRGRVEGKVGRFYGGVRAETVPQPDDAGNVDVYFGMRPRIGDLAMDVSYTQDVDAPCCGAVALDVRRDVGTRGRVGGRFYFDAAGETAETEARATVTVVRGYQVGGGVGGRLNARSPGEEPQLGFDLGVSRALADLCQMDLRYRDAIAAAASAEMSVEVKF